MLVVQEVVLGDGPVLGIAVNGIYFTLPMEVFTNKKGPGACWIYTTSVLQYLLFSSQGFVASYYFKSLSQLILEEKLENRYASY